MSTAKRFWMISAGVGLVSLGTSLAEQVSLWFLLVDFAGAVLCGLTVRSMP